MRFRHRVIPPEQAPTDAVGNIELPDDLVALGDRLRGDAEELAARYPARMPDEEAAFEAGRFDEASSHARRYRYVLRVVAGLLLAVACWPLVARLAPLSSDSGTRVTESSPASLPSTLVEQRRPSGVVSAEMPRTAAGGERSRTRLAARRDGSGEPSYVGRGPSAHETARDFNRDANPAGYDGKGPLGGIPAVFLQDVSGPELEGLLDLWEEEKSTASSVSI